ncbi:MAG: VWA domain-containing protein [Deltaproteobacteria bacterium]|nr:VWA domain-containing protein [Deltaproteobacteria bacterium]
MTKKIIILSKHAIVLLFSFVLVSCLEIQSEDGNSTGGETSNGDLKSDKDLGYKIACTAPDRDQFIEENTNTDLEEEEVDVVARAHNILFLFDKSGSMASGWDGETKWQSAADSMITTVETYKSYVTAGSIFYPTESCEVAPIDDEHQIDFTDAGDFLARFEAETNMYLPEGSTPMNAAFQRADEALAMACNDGLMDHPTRVVLLTDGEPNCVYDEQELLDYAAKWHEHGIDTYIIGLPGYGANYLLNQIAKAGGTSPELPDTDEDSDGQLDNTWDIDGDGMVDTDFETDFDTEAVMESNTSDDLHDNLVLAID